jgi:hypothetical protein
MIVPNVRPEHNSTAISHYTIRNPSEHVTRLNDIPPPE